MKNLLFIFTLLAAVTVQAATPTNTVTVPGLLFATTPLGGTERVPVYQSGLKSATVDQIAAAAAALGNGAKSYALSASNILAAALQTATNNLALLSNSATATTTNFNAASNLFSARLNSLGALSKSNILTLSNLADAGSVAGRGSNDFYLASNPANYQSGVQVTTTVNSALAAGGGVTNGGTVVFANVATPTLDLGSVTTLSSGTDSTNYVVNLSASSFQKVIVTPRTSNSKFNFVFTNAVDGENIWLLATAVNGIAWKFSASAGVDYWTVDSFGNPTTTLIVGSANTTALLNWQVIGGRVIFTAAIHP